MLIPLLATGLAAVLFQPLRQRLQGAVNRMMYGARDEPVAVLTQLGAQLERTGSAETALARIVETVALTLKLSYTAVTLPDQTTPIASFGIPTAHVRPFPLTYQGQLAGHMLVAGRPPDGELTPKDVQLLDKIALQAGVVVHNVHLTAELRRSWQKLITTREEERRRLRRDLHDGLGPTLASHMLKIGSARALLRRDPATAERLLGELESDIENTLAEVRRLVYNLRPPALDQWGLAGAIRAYAAECENGTMRDNHQKLTIKMDVPETLPPLPAAVEVAAYHIAREGLTNVVRHAQARHCMLRLWVDGGENGRLHLTIHDDGQGLSEGSRAGVGPHGHARTGR